MWGFTHFQVVNYLIFREKVPKFSPQSLQLLAIFEGEKSLKVLSNKVFRFIQQTLIKWLYENQGEMRFSSENRLFLVLIDTSDFSSSWKLKRNLDILAPAINSFLDDFGSRKESDLTVNFNYPGKPQTFSALADIIFVVK